MAATATTTPLVQSRTIKPKRRRYRETATTTTASAVSSSAAASDQSFSSGSSSTVKSNYQNRNLDTPTVINFDDYSRCCSTAAKPPLPPHSPQGQLATALSSSLPNSSASNLKIRSSPSSLPHLMENHGGAAYHDSFPESFSKFNSALTAGLLNPMSPPPAMDNVRSSPTLFEMMASEPDSVDRITPMIAQLIPNGVVATPNQKLLVDKQATMQQRLIDLLSCRSPGNQFNDSSSSDVKLTLSSKDAFSVSMSVHRQILVVQSRFFSEKLGEKWVKQSRNVSPYVVEIGDCDDIEAYVETLKLMYCRDLRKRLMKEGVPWVLGILKVSAAIGFDAGVLSCLEFLEAAPWAEDEEDNVAALLSELHLEGVKVGEVLKRISLDVSGGMEEKKDNEEVLLKLIQVVLQGKDEKARREMKSLVLKMLHENSAQSDLRKESLYSACEECLQSLRQCCLNVAEADGKDVSQIARQADNLHWLLDILIDRQIAEDFLKVWASESKLAESYSKVPAIHRFEISRVTARLFVGIGKGQLLASKDMRCLLLRTWLVPFYDDFRWMRRSSKGLDRHLIEEGLCNTILTLPLTLQQEIFMSWFHRFLNSGEDCPNIRRGFEVWWRRAFWRRSGEPERPHQMRIVNATIENS